MFSMLTFHLRLLALTTAALVSGLRHSASGDGPTDGSAAPAHRDRGAYTTETVIVTALLASAALTILGIIIAKITSRANSITV